MHKRNFSGTRTAIMELYRFDGPDARIGDQGVVKREKDDEPFLFPVYHVSNGEGVTIEFDIEFEGYYWPQTWDSPAEGDVQVTICSVRLVHDDGRVEQIAHDRGKAWWEMYETELLSQVGLDDAKLCAENESE